MARLVTGVSFPVLIAPPSSSSGKLKPQSSRIKLERKRQHVHELRLQPNNSTSLRLQGPKHQVMCIKKRSTTSVRCDVKNWSLRSGPESVQLEVPTSVPVRVANELLQAGHRYLDVRTEDEFKAGHPAGAINIPYMFKVGSGMSKNPKFLEQVSSVFSQDSEIIVGCQSGKRSLMAATELHSAGFRAVVDLAGGYSAWVQNELPIERSR